MPVTSTSTPPAADGPPWPEPGVRHPVSVDEFDLMVAAGVFAQDARIELIDGEMLEMSPIHPPHAYVVRQLDRLLGQQVADTAVVSIQSPLRCERDSEPQPDVAVLRGPDDYVDRHPTAADAVLVVEVADSTLQYDRDRKVPLYGRSGVDEVWLVDVRRRCLTAFRAPGDGGYATSTVVKEGESVSPVAFPDVQIAVADLFPPLPAP